MRRFWLPPACCLLIVLLTGCAGAPSQPLTWQDASVDLVWPPAPDQPRVRYLRSLSGPGDFQEQSRTSGMLGWLLGERPKEPSLLNPFAVAVSRSGLVWIADNGLRMLYRIDPGTRKISYFQEFSGLELVSPSGVAVDDERGRVFLADAGHPQIFVLDHKGVPLDRWGPAEGFVRPAGLAVDPSGRLLVADVGRGAVFLFNAEGRVLAQFESKLNPGGRFMRPLSVAFGPAGEVLILDVFAFRIEVQNTQGELLGTIGKLGDAPGYLARPRGLAVDQEGHVFVTDSAFDNVQVFDMTGSLLLYWGGTGGQPGRFNLPAGLFVDQNHRLFVADAYNRRVQVFQLLP